MYNIFEFVILVIINYYNIRWSTIIIDYMPYVDMNVVDKYKYYITRNTYIGHTTITFICCRVSNRTSGYSCTARGRGCNLLNCRENHKWRVENSPPLWDSRLKLFFNKTETPNCGNNILDSFIPEFHNRRLDERSILGEVSQSTNGIIGLQFANIK